MRARTAASHPPERGEWSRCGPGEAIRRIQFSCRILWRGSPYLQTLPSERLLDISRKFREVAKLERSLLDLGGRGASERERERERERDAASSEEGGSNFLFGVLNPETWTLADFRPAGCELSPFFLFFLSFVRVFVRSFDFQAFLLSTGSIGGVWTSVSGYATCLGGNMQRRVERVNRVSTRRGNSNHDFSSSLEKKKKKKKTGWKVQRQSSS